MNLFIYESNIIDFTSRGLGALSDVILDTPPLVREKLNAEYSLEFDYPYDGRNFDLIKEERIVKASTPQGPQPFRIYKIKKDLDYITVYANHIVYDLAGNWIEDTFIRNKKGQEAIDQVLNKCIIAHKFKATSNISLAFNSRLVRKNPLEAIMGNEENSLINRAGGELKFDNYNISWTARRGKDRGFSIKYRKNLIGLDFTTDFSSVITKIQPIGFDGLLLPEKYVNSPLINKYAVIRTKEIKYEDVISKKISKEHEDAMNHDVALRKLREYAKKEFNNGIDKPQIDCTVNFVDLKQTEEYKNYEYLQDLQLGDDVYIMANAFGVNMKKRMTYYEWNVYNERYELITLNEGAEASYNMGLTGTINTAINNKLEHVYTQVNIVKKSADGKNTIFTGPDKPLTAQKGDIWFKIEHDGEETLMKFDGIEWIDPLKIKKLNDELENSKKSIEEAKAAADEASQNIEEKARAIQEEIKTTNAKVDGLQVGDRNLLLDSKKLIKNSNYPTARYTLSDNTLKDGEVVTFIIKGEMGDGKTQLCIYNSGGIVEVFDLRIKPEDFNDDGIAIKSGKWRIQHQDIRSSNSFIFIYIKNNTIKTESTIEWVKLVRGNKTSIDWTPAPEDINQNLNEFKRTSDQTLSVISDTSKKGLLSVINQQANNILFKVGDNGQKSKIMLTKEGAFMDTAFIESAHIGKGVINEGHFGNITFNWARGKTLDANEINVININADNITSNKTSFVQSAWNGINSSVTINSEKISIGGDWGGSIDFSRRGLTYFDKIKGQVMGYTYGLYRNQDDPRVNELMEGIFIGAELGYSLKLGIRTEIYKQNSTFLEIKGLSKTDIIGTIFGELELKNNLRLGENSILIKGGSGIRYGVGQLLGNTTTYMVNVQGTAGIGFTIGGGVMVRRYDSGAGAPIWKWL